MIAKLPCYWSRLCADLNITNYEEGQACADLGARTLIGVSRIALISIFIKLHNIKETFIKTTLYSGNFFLQLHYIQETFILTFNFT